ncbi:transposase domain-containing protein [Triplophysa rosa]|uniref:Transposase domain-containing protein n=1 Tax=Triplophysa rosa TaxID=992332 RepID=A0A9W7W7W9_TRIRA|nr:transposase domain-containing protein [Triplophysa rosa]
MRGDRNVRMSAGQINEVTQRPLSLRKAIPSCFVRKPRGLEDIDRWKATELRQFAVYTGKIVLKGVLPHHLYNHFFTFSVTLGLLLSPNTAVTHNSYSSELMTYLVSKTKELYGEHFMVYNIHSMTHLSAEAKNFGSLDACSAFPFENFLAKLKRLLRSGKHPLAQVAKRCIEMAHFPQTQSVVTTKCKTKRPNNAFFIGEGKCCVAIEEREDMDETGSPLLLCKVLEKSEPLFQNPCDSRMIGCFKVQSGHSINKLLPERQLTRTAIMVEENHQLFFFAILHTL